MEGENMNILAIDSGTKTGWAYSINGVVESGVQTFELKRGESPGMRFVRFNAWLREIMFIVRRSHMPDVVVFEQAHHRGGAATELCVGMTTRIVEACAAAGIEHAAVHSTTLKKHATGSGRAEKSDMIAASKKRWPNQTIIDDNQADALALLSWAIAEYRAY